MSAGRYRFEKDPENPTITSSSGTQHRLPSNRSRASFRRPAAVPHRSTQGNATGAACLATAIDLLQVLNTGHLGSMTTIHANNALKNTVGDFQPAVSDRLLLWPGHDSSDVDPQIEFQLMKSVRVVADNNIFWRASLRDGMYGLATNLLVSGNEHVERYVGSQPSAGVYWQINRHLSLSAASGHFFVGTFLVTASPPRRSVGYAAAWVTYKV
jgi:hypothetical protein